MLCDGSLLQHPLFFTGSGILYSYWLLHLEAAHFPGISLIQLQVWVPTAPHPHPAELVLEFEDHWRSTLRFFLGSFPIVSSSYQSVRERIIIRDLLFAIVLGGAGTHPHGQGNVSITELLTLAWTSMSTPDGKRDAGLLVMSWLLEQRLMFHLPTCRSPLSLMWVPGQCHW